MGVWIHTCEIEIEKIQAREEADTLFAEGQSLFEAKKYDEAKAKFAEAKSKYVTAGGDQRIKECDEWIKKSEEAGVTIIPVLIALIIVLFIFKRKH
jgi:hypothetical protein